MINGIEITEISINLVKKDGPLLAYVNITLNDAVCIHNIRVVRLDGRLFLSYPSEISKNQVRRTIAFPCTREMGDEFSKEILEQFLELIKENTL